MYKHDIELEENNFTKFAKPEKNTYISRMLDECVRTGTIWLMTDLHLYKRDTKGSHACHKRKGYHDVVERINNIPESDVLICLGDIVDGEMNDPKIIKDIFKNVKCKMILVRGNNDLFDYTTYRDAGFRYVVYTFVYKNYVFSHYPIDNNNILNIHGHMHSNPENHLPTYWLPFKNHIDIAYFGAREMPVTFDDMIKPSTFKEYKKIIKEDPSKFSNLLTTESGDLFDIINSGLYGYTTEDIYDD